MTRQFLITRLSILFLAFILASCGSSDEIIVVEQAPTTEPSQAEEPVTENEPEDSFKEVTIGLIDPVLNFDPLFARNLSTQRVITLVYETLLTLDKNGEPVPALAKEVDISEDGTVYTITLDRSRFYQDSGVFPAGVGRRIHARDVKWAFERSARTGVPEFASSLLMNINGYENYFLEQRTLYDESRRVLDGVNGIQVADAATVLIELNEPDSLFLQKLASPYLSIYPEESVANNPEGIAENPVGSGPYEIVRSEEGARIVLTAYESSDEQTEREVADIDRVEFIYLESEAEMFQRFANGDVDWIPEISPGVQRQVLTENDELNPAYEEEYSAVHMNANRITAFYLNQRATVNQEWLRSRLAMLTSEDFYSENEVRLYTENFMMNETAEPEEQYYVMLTDNMFAKNALTELHNLVFQPESALVFIDIRVPTRVTSIYTRVNDSMYNSWNPIEDGYWLRMDSKIVSLHNTKVSNVEPSVVPWLLHLDDVEVNENE
jgi:ABC-type transport system substrate-binding protein